MSFFGKTATTLPKVPSTVSKEVEVPNAPNDTVSCLRFSPPGCNSTLLFAGSWDKTVRLWQISSENGVQMCLSTATQAPILDACWNDDGSEVYICGVDTYAYRWHLQTNTITQIAKHDAPIRTINYIKALSYTCIMTGGWDKKLKFWNLKDNSLLQVIDLSGQVYCADVRFPMAVVATSDRHITIYDLTNGPVEVKRLESQLKLQTRCIKIFIDKNTNSPAGFALGSIEGRVSIQSLDINNLKASFTFKCHRSAVVNTTQDIYSVNDISFNPIHHTLVTVGSDGIYTFWDKDARTKLSGSESNGQQMITACDISANGTIFVYSSGYDWSKGHEGNDLLKKPKIYLKECFEVMKPQLKK